MIHVEPIPPRRMFLRSTLGKPLFENGAEQRIDFSARVVKRRHRYNESRTLLATGEKLEDLEGGVILYRGTQRSENGELFRDAIIYHPALQADHDTPEMTAGFLVQLFLEERLFDQVVSLSHVARLPSIELDFDFTAGPIKYGDAPDGSEKTWNNKEHTLANVRGAVLFLPLADQTDKHQALQGEPLPDPEFSPPTVAQLDRRFRETQELLIRLRGSIMLLTWAVLGIAGILIITRVI